MMFVGLFFAAVAAQFTVAALFSKRVSFDSIFDVGMTLLIVWASGAHW